MNKLNLDQQKIASCRAAAEQIAGKVHQELSALTTLSVERSVLRLCGIDGVDAFEVPVPNLMVEQAFSAGVLGEGITRLLASALKATGLSLQAFASAFVKGQASLLGHPLVDGQEASSILWPFVQASFERIAHNRNRRQSLLSQRGWPDSAVYVIVATGNIYEDVKQAQSAARAGADIVAVIRTTGQSLLDYVPYGATTEGFGGTTATQENFRIMRAALDQVGDELGRYIMLVNYASGLCMPEIAAIGALEGLDMMLNDSLYGIIFRDINMQRTFVDQHFSRSLNAVAGIIINTGEDNYLTTADAVQSAHTVLASQFINERFALIAGLKEEQMGLGHAFEINPMYPGGFLYELAQAQLSREVFPKAPLKYMPPTKHSTGNIFQTQAQDTMFNAATVMTGQSIHLLAMMTEAIHTPFLSDRHFAITNAKMVQATMEGIYDEISFKEGGIIQTRAAKVLDEAEALLNSIRQSSLFDALAKGTFADVKRLPDGGKGQSGVVQKAGGYVNVAMEAIADFHKEVGK